jgi:hypothetical protein
VQQQATAAAAGWQLLACGTFAADAAATFGSTMACSCRARGPQKVPLRRKKIKTEIFFDATIFFRGRNHRFSDDSMQEHQVT